MEAPPQFPGAPKKSKTGLIIGGTILAVLLCCCGVCGIGGYLGKDAIKSVFQNSLGMVGCSIAMDEQRSALIAYAEKHNGTLPPAKVWQDSIKPFIQRNKEFDDPSQPIRVPNVTDDFCDGSANTSIAFNAALAGKKLDSVKDQMGTVALFEISGRGRNQSAPWKEQSFANSPKILSNAPRGWIRQGLRGEVTIKDQSGNVKPVPRVNEKANAN
ncbi:hypothetical protein EON82_14425 [bacterium]|nr:MAG: hypothetical protein EON82_14425 [bacterium]